MEVEERRGRTREADDGFAVAPPFVASVSGAAARTGYAVSEEDAPADAVPHGTAADRRARLAEDNAQKAERIAEEVSDLLFSVYNSVEGLVGGLSMGETRIVQFVGDETLAAGREVTVSAIASAVAVKVSSATASVNKLVRKGLLTKRRSTTDARCVNVGLTPEGERLYHVRRGFYRSMARSMTKGMSSRDVDLLLVALGRLERFYRSDRAGQSGDEGRS